MTEPRFGIQFFRDDNEPRPTIPSDMSVIGLVLPSADADAGRFPLNVPVEFNSNDRAYLEDMGTGPLYQAITNINDQLADFQVAARVVAVRVAQGGTVDETITNIIGDESGGTGLYGLLRAGQILAVIPRLIGCPGFTGQFTRTDADIAVSRAAKSGGNTGAGLMTLASPAYGADAKNGVYQVRIIGDARAATSAAKAGGNTGNGTLGTLTADGTAAAGAWRVICEAPAADGGAFLVLKPDGTTDGVALVGTAYNSAAGINFTLTDGSADFIAGDEFVVTVVPAVSAGGGAFTVTDPDGNALPTGLVGTPYTAGTHLKFTIADGTPDFIIGDGFDVTVAITAGTAEANPICAVLPAICTQLLAHAVVGGPGTTKQDAIDWRETINSERLICVDNWEKRVRGGVSGFEDGAASVLGIGAATDFKFGGVPSRSWANQPVTGLVGLKRYDAFSLTDGATDAQILLTNNIGVTVRGELGVETAIASNGFVFIGTDGAGDDELWRFYNVTRMRDYIHLLLIKATRKRLGTTNITPHGIQAVLNDITFALRDLKYGEHILGGHVGFEKSANSPENMRLGIFRVFFAAEEPAPLRRLDIDSRRDREALTVMLETIIAQSNTLVA